MSITHFKSVEEYKKVRGIDVIQGSDDCAIQDDVFQAAIEGMKRSILADLQARHKDLDEEGCGCAG